MSIVYTTHIQQIKRTLVVIMMLMTVAIGVYVWRYVQDGAGGADPVKIAQVDNDADVLATNVELTEMSHDRIVWTLVASEAKMYTERKETHLKDVDVVFYNERGQKSMHLTSDRGIKDDKTGNVTASGNVVATSFEEGATLKTSSLMYDASIQKIVSDQHVIIQRGSVITSGKGLESNLSLTEAKILRDITTSFATDDVPSFSEEEASGE